MMEALAAAVRSNDVERVRRVLSEHPELNARLDEALPGDAFGATPLLCAVHQGNRELVDLLLQTGADINVRSHWWAGGFGVLDHDGDLAPFLIERGAVVDAHAAARLGMLDRLRALIGADPAVLHARGGDGQTPLHFAKNIAVAELLLAHGADLDARDVDHESTPAQWMIRDRQEVVRYLISRGCRTDLLMAAALGDLALVRKHLDADPAGIRMSVSDEWFPRENPQSAGTIYNWTLYRDMTAPFIARKLGHEEVYQYLMERTPEPLQLAVACEVGEASRVRNLLARRPDLAASLSHTEQRKLPDAARDDNPAAVRLMLDAGWPVDARGQEGGTALHWAAWRGDADMVCELLSRGAPVDDRNNNYKSTALRWASYASVHGWHPDRGDYPGTVEALLKAGAKPPAASEEFVASDAVRAVLRTR
ncbi:MAG TPA: ankyrin repeat domain-containing protein [Gemmatimonadales bacterium]|jgi:ankyrin repeat protein|nr:ankyrin repeat domain-containing protein [Gemmatimonadales bacterium]